MYDLAVIFAFEIIAHKTVIASTKQDKFSSFPIFYLQDKKQGVNRDYFV